MITKQISVFIENRKGRMGDILDVLKGGNVNILSLSLSDTEEYGLLRIISDKPQEGKEALTNAGFSSMLTDVFIIKLPHAPGSLQNILRMISDEELNVEYMYGLSMETDEAYIKWREKKYIEYKVYYENYDTEKRADIDTMRESVVHWQNKLDECKERCLGRKLINIAAIILGAGITVLLTANWWAGLCAFILATIVLYLK